MHLLNGPFGSVGDCIPKPLNPRVLLDDGQLGNVVKLTVPPVILALL